MMAAESAETAGVWREYERPARDQLFLVPVSMRDWVEADHVVWFVLDVVQQMNTKGLHARPAGAPGRRPYEPEMMLALLLYGYSCGIRHSRRLEAACRTDAAFRIICGGLCPDHATIARFVVDHEQALQDLFVDGLRLCAAAGLVDLSVVALDGTKIAGDASRQRNRDVAWIRKEIAKLTAVTGQSDQPPAIGGDGPLAGAERRAGGRLDRLKAALAEVEAQDAAAVAEATARAEAAEADAVRGHHRLGRKPTDPHAALARARIDRRVAIQRLAEQHELVRIAAAAVQETGRRPAGLKRPHVAKATAKLARAEAAIISAQEAIKNSPDQSRHVNVTDPDSRIMTSKNGWVQGYNAQAVVSSSQIVLACDVSQSPNDKRLYQPMIAALAHMLESAGITQEVQLVLADTGYFSEANLTCPGPDRLIATQKDWKERKTARAAGHTEGPPPPGLSCTAEMEHIIRTPQGTAAYKQRSSIIEAVFGQTKHNQGTRQFRRRGHSAVTSEWAFINLVHNLKKLYRAQTITA